MPKSNLHIRPTPELTDLEHFFLNQVSLPEQRLTPISLPFFNFVVYVVDMLTSYTKSTLDIPLNVFLVDEHLRRHVNSAELYRKFVGFIQSWKKYSETEEGKLFGTFLQRGRNDRSSVRLFLRLRKILLKNINQKILKDISLSHEDVVTIIHTLDMVSSSQRKLLVKKINQYFIAKNVKYLNTIIINGAVFCEFLIEEINHRPAENHRPTENDNPTESDRLTLTNKMCKIKHQLEYIQEFSEEAIPREEVSFCHDEFESEQFNTHKSNISFAAVSRENRQPEHSKIRDEESKESKESKETKESKESMMNLQKCMQELCILKEKDQEIDNRFKRIGKNL